MKCPQLHNPPRDELWKRVKVNSVSYIRYIFSYIKKDQKCEETWHVVECIFPC